MKRFLILFLVLLVPLLYPHSYGKPNIKTILPKTKVVKILWVSESFSDEEKMLIKESAYEWERATKEIVKFIIVFDRKDLRQKFQENYKDSLFELQIIVFEKIKDNDLITFIMDGVIKGKLLGYYNDRSEPSEIWLVTDRFENDRVFKNVTMHELGHALRLEHIDIPYTLMYASEGRSSDCLTFDDLFEFCRIYKCYARDLNYCTY